MSRFLSPEQDSDFALCACVKACCANPWEPAAWAGLIDRLKELGCDEMAEGVRDYSLAALDSCGWAIKNTSRRRTRKLIVAVRHALTSWDAFDLPTIPGDGIPF